MKPAPSNLPQPKDLDLPNLYKRADRARQNNQPKVALSTYVLIARRWPDQWRAYLHAGALLAENGHVDAGLIALKRAAGIAPDNVTVVTELGAALKSAGHHDEAIAVLDRALELDPHNIHAAFLKGELLLRINRTAEAFAWFDVVVKGQKDTDNIKAVARWLRGVARLTLGDYQNAWEDYEARIYHPTTTFPELRGEHWTGQPLDGKTLFLAYEQRFGDVIQFARFIPQLIRQGASIILETPNELTRFFRSLDPAITLHPFRTPLPEYDFTQLVTSIPAILNYSREQLWEGPYLDITDDEIEATVPLRQNTALKVGLVWSGKPVPNRSIPLKYLVPLLKHREVSFYSFQLGRAREQMRDLRVGWLLEDLSERIEDFHDSSVFMRQMDLLITIDTAAAHQAGAMGIPTWLLLIYYSDWRWGEYGTSVTPWYPSLRIFRQIQFNSWTEISKILEQEFSQWVEKKMRVQGDFRSFARS